MIDIYAIEKIINLAAGEYMPAHEVSPTLDKAIEQLAALVESIDKLEQQLNDEKGICEALRSQNSDAVKEVRSLEQQIEQWKGRVANDRPDIALEIQQAEKRGKLEIANLFAKTFLGDLSVGVEPEINTFSEAIAFIKTIHEQSKAERDGGTMANTGDSTSVLEKWSKGSDGGEKKE